MTDLNIADFSIKRMKFSIIAMLVLVLVLLPAVSAGTFKQFTDVEISKTIAQNGTSTGVTANITVKDPDNLFIAQGEMTFNTSTNQFNYTIPAGKTGKLGIYPYEVCAYSSIENECFSFTDVEVTPSGDSGLLGFSFLVMTIIYGMVFLGVYKRDVTITLLGTFGLYFLGIWILFFGIDVLKNWVTNGFALITMGFASYLSIVMALDYIQD